MQSVNMVSVPVFQSCALDQLGNWSEFDDQGTSQTRDANAANEITSISGQQDPTYDAAGNMIEDSHVRLPPETAAILKC